MRPPVPGLPSEKISDYFFLYNIVLKWGTIGLIHKIKSGRMKYATMIGFNSQGYNWEVELCDDVRL